MSANQGSKTDFDVWEFCAAQSRTSNQVSPHTTIQVDIKKHAHSLHAFSAVRAVCFEVENREHSFNNIAQLESLISEVNSAPGETGFTIDQTMARDITRETALFGVRLEKVARLFLACMQHRGITCIVLNNAEWLDQGTIRVISRIARIAGENTITIRLGFQKNSNTKPTEMSAITFSRYVLWERVQRSQSTLTGSIPTCALRLELTEFRSENEFHTCVAKAISDVSYDLALYFCLCAENQFSGNKLARALMVKSTIECKIGRTAQGLELAEQSLATAKSLSLKSKAHYLIGQINAKRVGNHIVASKHFNQGRDLMLQATEDADDLEEMMIEAAWQEHGLAFLEAMKQEAKSVSDKATHLHKAILYEKYALSRILSLSTPKANYLKFSLIKNLLLWQEMQGEYEQALSLFNNEFVTLARKHATETSHLEMTLAYRVALLQYKSGDRKSALASLQSAYEHAVNGENMYAEARVLFALACMYNDTEQFTDANEKLIALYGHVLNTHDATMAKELVAMFQYVQVTSNSFSFGTHTEFLRNNFDLSQNSGLSAVRKPEIATELPSFNALVDMLPSPDEDLNKILTSLVKSNQDAALSQTLVADMV